MCTSFFGGFNAIVIDRDSDGFATSFSLSDPPDNIRAFFDRCGFVVIRDILTEAECTTTLDEYFERAEFNVKLDDPATYNDLFLWQRFANLGIMSPAVPMGPNCDFTPQLLRNRMNPNLYAAYKILFQTEKLIVDHDRIGFMRPTKAVPMRGQDGAIVIEDKPEWKTIERWLHLDCNPCTGKCGVAGFLYHHQPINLEKHLVVQGLIALTDAREEDGGFHCIPGFHKHVKSHVSTLDDVTNTNVQLPKGDPLRECVQRIPLRKGSICVWNTLLYHGNFPNNSSNYRAVQYVRMASHPVFEPLVIDPTSYNLEISELGKKLFGIWQWDYQ